MDFSDDLPRARGGTDVTGTLLHWLPAIAAVAASGALGGLLAGLLGVGGGIVIVPVLDAALEIAGVPSGAALHVAVATSMATIIPTSVSSSRSHARRGSVDFELMRRWSVPIVLGSLAGALAAARMDARILAAVFGFVALAAALKMLLPLDDVVLRRSVPGGLAGATIPATIGAVSAMMGIGGGTMSVPAMTLCGEPVHKAVGTAALTGLWISIPATVCYLLSPAADAAGMPLTIGYVSLPGFLVIAPVAWAIAPIGVRLAHSLDRRRLSAAFGVFLALVAARMLYRAFA
jgi:uncharacterized membrane protein YfcA